MCSTSSCRQSDAAKRRTDSSRPNESCKTTVDRSTKPVKRKPLLPAVIAIGIAVAAVGFLSRGWWLPQVGLFLGASQESSQDGHVADPHAGHDHAADAPASGDENSLELSAQAQKNVGLKLLTIEPRDFDRTISVPAKVAQRPGQTQIKVSASMTGIVERIYPIRGEAVTPGQPLFDLRLTHKDLVDTQIAFLRIIEQLDVINREVIRLDKVTSSGAIAGKRLLEREYEQQKAKASLRAQQQALILHGLSRKQIEDIEKTRKLLQRVTVFSPPPLDTAKIAKGASEKNASEKDAEEHLLQVSTIEVGRGEHVETGDPLCVLSDHESLYIEGKAFEEDAARLNEAANTAAPVSAVIEASGSRPRTVSGLKILYLENEVEQDSRALRFYIHLPNELVRNEKTKDGHRFIGWRFKPGQRVQLLIPVERWKDCIVLPVDAVVKEGANYFIFQKNGNRFVRKPVHVEYRDQRWAVIDNDGNIFPGDTVVTSGAYQMYLTMKNKAGGGVDPHAGCQH